MQTCSIFKSEIIPAIFSEIKHACKRVKAAWRRWDDLEQTHSERFAYFVEDVDDGFIKVNAIKYKLDGKYSMFMIESNRGKKLHIDIFAIENMDQHDKDNLEKLKKLTKLEPVDWE